MNPFLAKIVENIINPAILLIFAVALLVFLWGVLQFVRKADDEKARETGRNQIIYGIIGMAIMISAFGILHFITGTFNLDDTPVTNLEK